MYIQNNVSTTNFKAVKMSPAPDQWNQRVLNAVLKSEFVNNIVKEDAKNGRDTFLSYAEHFDPAYPDYTRYNHMFVNIAGNNKDITLGSHSTYRFESPELFRRAKEIKTGPEKLDVDLAEQITNLDPPDVRNKKVPISKSTIEYLRKLAGGIIYEEGKNYEKFRN